MTIRAEQRSKEASRMMCKPFTPARFEQLVKEFQEQEGKILSHKGNEYSDQEDRLLNFREVAEVLGRTPAEVALSYLLKHIQSIALAVKTGKYTWAWATEGGEGLKQRIADARNSCWRRVWRRQMTA